jgi:DNA-binding CsgD family transcriptional regulator/PAS domain-containing protein
MSDHCALVASAYEAVADASLWPHLLAQLARAEHLQKIGVYAREDQTGRLVVLETHGYEQAWVDQFVAHHAATSAPHSALKDYPVGRAAVLRLPATYFRSALYNEWMKPQDIHHILGGIVSRADGRYLALTGLRSKGEGSFTRSEVSLHSRIIQHLKWAYLLKARMRQAGETQQGFWVAWEASPQALILLDQHGRVFYCNPAARAVLDAPHGLAIRCHRLAATRSHDGQALERLVRAAQQPGQGGVLAGGSFVLHHPRGGRDLTVQVFPLSTGTSWHSPGAARVAVAVFLIVPPGVEPYSALELMARFGLTAAEARLTRALAEGGSLRQIADRLDMSYFTARSHLRSIFAKTGLHRQAELVRLFVSHNVPDHRV